MSQPPPSILLADLKLEFPLCFLHEGVGMWGVECGGGWSGLIRDLLGKLVGSLRGEREQYIDGEFPFRIDQIKEKFGTLRFYVSGAASDSMMEAIMEAESLSACTCERCGAPGAVRVSRAGFWLKTLCPECAGSEWIPYNRNRMP
jgi:hypothetical protein